MSHDGIINFRKFDRLKKDQNDEMLQEIDFTFLKQKPYCGL